MTSWLLSRAGLMRSAAFFVAAVMVLALNPGGTSERDVEGSGAGHERISAGTPTGRGVGPFGALDEPSRETGSYARGSLGSTGDPSGSAGDSVGKTTAAGLFDGLLGGSPTPEPTPTPTPSSDAEPTPEPEDCASPTWSGTASDTAVDPLLTQVRLRLWSTSDWAALDILGSRFREHRVDEVPAGTSVEVGSSGFSIKGAASPSPVVVSAVLAVPEDASPTLRLRKGYFGTARAEVVRTSGSETLVAELSNEEHNLDNTTYTSISRETLVGPGLTFPMQDPRRLTLAFYYPWFHSKSFDSGGWWEKPAGPFDTTDPDEVRAMVDRAADAGIDGFVVSWNGDHQHGFNLVQQAACERGDFFVAPLFELRQARSGGEVDFDIVDAWMDDVLGRAQETLLHVGDRPVFFLYGTWDIGADAWSSFREGLADPVPFFVGDRADRRLALDGQYLYNPNTLSDEEVHWRYRGMHRKLRLPPRFDEGAAQPLWASTVSPGMNNTYVKPLSPTIRDRKDGYRYDVTWRASLRSHPEWVMVTSWNEWFEATHVQQGQRTGKLALEQTRSWSGQFGGG